MLNSLVVVGRIVADPIVNVTENGKSFSNITIAVPRSYKNEEGVYEADFIDCTLWNNVANTTAEYMRKGDMIGVRGRLESNVVEKDGERKKFLNILVEKVTFLSSKQKEQSHDEVEPEMEM